MLQYATAMACTIKTTATLLYTDMAVPATKSETFALALALTHHAPCAVVVSRMMNLMILSISTQLNIIIE